jgi:hypothetical protein
MSSVSTSGARMVCESCRGEWALENENQVFGDGLNFSSQ